MLKQDDVASLCGLSRVQVARVYQLLRTKGIIDTSRGILTIIDMEALKQMASDTIVEK